VTEETTSAAVLLINRIAVGDPSDAHDLAAVVDEVNDAVISDTDAPLVSVAYELFASWRPGVLAKRQDLAVYPGKQLIAKGVQFFARG
jgi:hypothetical protein